MAVSFPLYLFLSYLYPSPLLLTLSLRVMLITARRLYRSLKNVNFYPTFFKRVMRLGVMKMFR